MKRIGAALVVVSTLVSGTALAAEKNWDGGYDVPKERRSGFAGSLGFSVGLGHVEGYPNAVSKIDEPAYLSSTGAAPGTSLGFWLGGAIRDWFTLGLGISTFGASSGGIKGSGTAYVLHVEAFPLYPLGGKLRDLALFANVGAGGMSITGGPEKADGGLMSVLGLGATYELLRFGHFTLGPVLEGGYRFSQSATAYGLFAGIRTTIYGGP